MSNTVKNYLKTKAYPRAPNHPNVNVIWNGEVSELVGALLHALSIQASKSVKILHPSVDLPQAQVQLLIQPQLRAFRVWNQSLRCPY